MEQKIRSTVSIGPSISASRVSRTRARIIEVMEKELNIWIDDCAKRRISIDTNAIQQRALMIFNSLKETGEYSVVPDFVASKGWLERYKKRFSLHHVKIQEESALNVVETCLEDL